MHSSFAFVMCLFLILAWLEGSGGGMLMKIMEKYHGHHEDKGLKLKTVALPLPIPIPMGYVEKGETKAEKPWMAESQDWMWKMMMTKAMMKAGKGSKAKAKPMKMCCPKMMKAPKMKAAPMMCPCPNMMKAKMMKGMMMKAMKAKMMKAAPMMMCPCPEMMGGWDMPQKGCSMMSGGWDPPSGMMCCDQGAAEEEWWPEEEEEEDDWYYEEEEMTGWDTVDVPDVVSPYDSRQLRQRGLGTLRMKGDVPRVKRVKKRTLKITRKGFRSRTFRK